MSAEYTTYIKLAEEAKNGILPSMAQKKLYAGEEVKITEMDFDSLAAVKFLMLVEAEIGVDVQLAVFDHVLTFQELVASIERIKKADEQS